MCDEPLRTVVETDQGPLAFQDYFVREQCRPTVRAIRFDGAQAAKPSPQVRAALADPALAGIIICPSNPWLSVDPILAVPGLREAIRASGAPVIAVSPIIAGNAVKGPTAKIMRELNLQPGAASIAQHYAGLIDGFLIDSEDHALADAIAIPVRAARTLMQSLEDKVGLARECLDFCAALKPARGRDSAEPRECARDTAPAPSRSCPSRRSADAKRRLAPALAPSERRRLVLTMLEDVLALLGEVPGITRVLVVTPDPEVAAAAASHGAGIVSEDGPSDLNAAVRRGLAHARSQGAERALVIPADVPLATQAEMLSILASACRRPETASGHRAVGGRRRHQRHAAGAARSHAARIRRGQLRAARGTGRRARPRFPRAAPARPRRRHRSAARSGPPRRRRALCVPWCGGRARATIPGPQSMKTQFPVAPAGDLRYWY